ncbi:hypothetical protein PR202_ga05618 [Eleusine coracana subsp. coracana]|uniref:GDSL esterase/lipase n=1 Tax=Eleusine coracana subsp. coracana TaxID=191504 RepID=A0AAV5BV40_ELECO|nr:hypothetical protein PR202_ga05164 [Eleusine coracana subsp. coracana]GJM89423.1 hypothetical protein PR202_ga05618 [Eleusine coracana subsp. coracana]
MELTILLPLVIVLSSLSGVSSTSRNFTSMFTLGDSYMDTGNFVIMASPAIPTVFDKPPYGMTFFGHPTGRYSDGRVIIDFIAEALGLPLLPAFLSNSSDVSRGVNFAVGGATAIDVGFFERNNLVQFKLLNNSLHVQLGWFEELIRPSLCNATEGVPQRALSAILTTCLLQRRTHHSRFPYGTRTLVILLVIFKSLFIVGEFRIKDYNFLWMANKTEDEVRSYMPRVVKIIVSAVERLIIRDGAAFVVVPGNPPNGCSPAILTMFRSPNAADYDSIGCLRGINAVARQHNALLRAALGGLRGQAPPRHHHLRRLLRTRVVRDVLKACCGTGGAYNWNASSVCGMPGATACRNPAAYVSWDGVTTRRPSTATWPKGGSTGLTPIRRY